jgi:hypothetical protein
MPSSRVMFLSADWRREMLARRGEVDEVRNELGKGLRLDCAVSLPLRIPRSASK